MELQPQPQEESMEEETPRFTVKPAEKPKATASSTARVDRNALSARGSGGEKSPTSSPPSKSPRTSSADTSAAEESEEDEEASELALAIMSGRVRDPNATPPHAAASSAAGGGVAWTEVVGKGNKGKGKGGGAPPAGRGGGYGLQPLQQDPCAGTPLQRRVSKIDARAQPFAPRGAPPTPSPQPSSRPG